MPEISKTADQTLAVLECVAEHGPLNPTEIARRLKMHRPAVHRSLETLHRRGYVRRTAEGYLPGVAVLKVAQKVEPALLSQARPLLAKLAKTHRETFILTILDGAEAVLVDQAVGGHHFVRIQFTPGFRHSLAQGASGRAILAFLDPAEVTEILLARKEPKSLELELLQVRRTGVAVSHNELSSDVFGVSAPVMRRGNVVASLGVVLPTARAGDTAALTRGVKAAAAALSRKMQPG